MKYHSSRNQILCPISSKISMFVLSYINCFFLQPHCSIPRSPTLATIYLSEPCLLIFAYHYTLMTAFQLSIPCQYKYLSVLYKNKGSTMIHCLCFLSKSCHRLLVILCVGYIQGPILGSYDGRHGVN